LKRLNVVDENDLRQLRNLSTPVWIFDVDRNFIWWANAKGLLFWKAGSLQELRERDFSSDSATVQERLHQIVDLGSWDAHITDTWTLYPDGSPETVILSFQPIKINTNIDGVLIELVQVLERDGDDDTWRLLEATRATSLIMTTFSLEGDLLAQNPASLACFGWKGSGSDGLTALEARFEDRAVAQRVLESAASNLTASWEAAVVTTKGIRIHSLSVRKGRDPITGDFVTVLCEEDVTKHANFRSLQISEKEVLKQEVAQSDEMLRVSQERYALAVQTAGIWDWDMGTDRLFMSPNFIEALGYTKKEFHDVLKEERLVGFLHPDDVDGYRAKIAEHLAQPTEPLTHDLRFLSKSKEVLWYHCQGKCVVDGQGKATRSAGLLTDISQRKRLETTLLASQRMEAVGQLTGGIAHDFNNLLTVIQGNAELLAELGGDYLDLVDEIVRAVRRGAGLTRHLLAFAGKQTLNPKSVDLNLLVTTMKKTLLRAIGEIVTIKVEVDDDLWRVHADRSQIEAAILNMALNARDAMLSGGTMTIACENVSRDHIPDYKELGLKGDQYVRISMIDTGDGMTKETQLKAFEPFFTTKGVGQGSGLGLSMVQGFSRQSQGAASLDSIPGKGTRVSIYLPRSATAQSPFPLTANPQIKRGNQEHVHILEDNQDVQNTVSKLVRSLGYQVSTSNDVDQAQRWMEDNPRPDLYLVDVILPGRQSGVDFARSLKVTQPDAKVLFMSGYSADQLGANRGFDFDMKFISKPFEKIKLADAVASALNVSRSDLSI
jgi:PAS domain S-box-containing protein